MLYTKFEGHQPAGSDSVFTIYGHGSHFGHMTNFVPPSDWGSTLIGSAVSEKMMFDECGLQTDGACLYYKLSSGEQKKLHFPNICTFYPISLDSKMVQAVIVSTETSHAKFIILPQCQLLHDWSVFWCDFPGPSAEVLNISLVTGRLGFSQPLLCYSRYLE